MNQDSLVSVIIPAYNASKFIRETLESVLKQTYENWECVVVDDGSRDDTPRIIQDFCNKDRRFKFLQGEHGGVSRARNLAISRSTGEFIALLDHDDLWSADKLEKQIPLFVKDPDVGLVYSDGIIDIINSKKEKYSNKCRLHKGWVFDNLAKKNFILCQSVVFRRSAVSDRNGPFVGSMEMVEEYELFVWLSLRVKFDYVNEPLITYRVHGSNDSLRRMHLFEIELKQIQAKLLEDPCFKKGVHTSGLKEIWCVEQLWGAEFLYRSGKRMQAAGRLLKKGLFLRYFLKTIRYLFLKPSVLTK